MAESESVDALRARMWDAIGRAAKWVEIHADAASLTDQERDEHTKLIHEAAKAIEDWETAIGLRG